MATKNDKSPGSHEILHTLGYRRLRSLFSCRQVVWVGVCLCLLALPDCPTTTPSGTTKQWSLVPNVASSEPYGSFLVLSDDPSSLRSRSNGTVPSRYLPNWESLDKRPLPLWYNQAKIGILIHWGVFSVPSFGSEWFWYHWKAVPREFYTRFMRKYYALNFIYTDFVTQFTARFFDPHQWAHLFKLAGARYAVLTSKHFDGFTLSPSSTSGNWNAVDAGPKRDLVGELSAAVKKARGMKFGLYHARYEWFNPLYQADKASDWENNSFVENKSIPELMEIVNKYQPEVIWSDGDWEAPDTYWKSMEFFAWLYNESPVRESVVVNDRWGDGTHCNHGIFYSCKDRYNPRVLHLHKRENSMSIVKLSWGYRREAQLSDYYTIEGLLMEVVSTISCNGNIVINVGPTKDGTIDTIFAERLAQLGSWLRVNSEAVYESKPWKHQNDSSKGDVWYTSNKSFVYIFILDWPKENELQLKKLRLSPGATITRLGLPNMKIDWRSIVEGKKSKVTVDLWNVNADLLPTPWC